jgi:hypothetical protein
MLAQHLFRYPKRPFDAVELAGNSNDGARRVYRRNIVFDQAAIHYFMIYWHKNLLRGLFRRQNCFMYNTFVTRPPVSGLQLPILSTRH